MAATTSPGSGKHDNPVGSSAPGLAQPWYGLFSRGARDWLRHNQKVRDAVQAYLPELIATPDLIGGPQ